VIPALLAAAALAAPGAGAASFGPKPKPYGVLILAYQVDSGWRQELGNLRRAVKGHAVESVTDASDLISVQRALDRLVAQHVGKVVGVPLETDSESVRLQRTRYLFGQRADAVRDRPGPAAGVDGLDMKPLKSPTKSALAPAAASGRDRRLSSKVPLVLAPAMDQSPVLVDILADRAKALARDPKRESLVLAGVAPRSDAALKDWQAAAQAVADKVGAKAGFARAVAVGVRDGVRAGQQDKDRAGLRKTFRELIRQGPVVAVPLSPDGERVGEMLKRTLGGFYAYRWDGKGVRGDHRLTDWIRSAAEDASRLPDGRQFKDGAGLAPGGGWP
jgi:hypothetical protein